VPRAAGRLGWDGYPHTNPTTDVGARCRIRDNARVPSSPSEWASHNRWNPPRLDLSARLTATKAPQKKKPRYGGSTGLQGVQLLLGVAGSEGNSPPPSSWLTPSLGQGTGAPVEARCPFGGTPRGERAGRITSSVMTRAERQVPTVIRRQRVTVIDGHQDCMVVAERVDDFVGPTLSKLCHRMPTCALCVHQGSVGGFQRRFRLPVSDIQLDASHAKCTNSGSGGG
jgi:hypothetical protein